MNLTPDAKRKQKALYHCLSDILTPEQLMEAMLLWQDHHAHRQGFAVRYFADDVAQLMGGGETPKALTLKMVQAIAQYDAALADPVEKISAYRLSVGRYVGSRKSSQVTAFNLLLKKILLLAGEDTAKVLKAQLKAHCLSSSLYSESLKAAMVKALRAPEFELMLDGVPVPTLKALVNACYVEACDEIGPVAADRLLSQSLMRLESNGGAQYTDIFKALM